VRDEIASPFSLRPSSVPSRGHQPCRVVVLSVSAQSPDARRPRDWGQPLDGAAVGAEVRPGLCQPDSPAPSRHDKSAQSRLRPSPVDAVRGGAPPTEGASFGTADVRTGGRALARPTRARRPVPQVCWTMSIAASSTDLTAKDHAPAQDAKDLPSSAEPVCTGPRLHRAMFLR
jgi:hypothetical protein